MKKIIFVALALFLGWGLFASQYVAAIPLGRIMSKSPGHSRYEALRLFSESEGEILYYDADWAITLVPAHKTEFRTQMLTEIKAGKKLYLAGKTPIYGAPEELNDLKILLEMEAGYLLETELDELKLRSRVPHPFCELRLQGIVFAPASAAPLWTDGEDPIIRQMVDLVNAASVESLIQGLQDHQTRYALADNRLQVSEWIQQKFLDFGLMDVVLQPFEWQNTTQYNVIATLPGSMYPDEYIIVGGHHDCITYHDPMVFAPGADDNASGSVATLEMARVMMEAGYQPHCSIRFVTYAAEEFGLWGSKHHSAQTEEAREQVRLMMNHDMIANQDDTQPWEVRLMPYDGSLDQSSHAARITEQYSDLSAYYGSLNSHSSDSFSYWQHGFNVIYFFESQFSPVYHSDLDLVANLNPQYCAQVIKASVACAATFADMPTMPSGFTAYDRGDGASMLLMWESAETENIDHFRVYHSGEFEDWSEPTQTEQTSCIITGLEEGNLYRFAVSSVDIYGHESFMVQTTGTPLSAPTQPRNFGDQPRFGAIELTWDNNQELDLDGYRLFRSASPDEPGTQIGGLIKENSYLDRDVVGGLSYYHYRLCAVDQQGNESPYAGGVKSRPVSLNQGILIVDETADLSGNGPFQPSDAQADEFYDAITAKFNCTELDLNAWNEELRLADICVYSTILWHGNDLSEMDAPYFAQDVLRQYVEAGGNILFSVYHPSLAFDLNSGYPVQFEEDSFIYDYIGIAEADHSNSARFKRANPEFEYFPPLEVDPEKTNEAMGGHIPRVEGMMPTDDCITVYSYASDHENDTAQGRLNGMAVGILNLNQDGKICTLSFPLYNMRQDDAQKLVEYVFTEYFGESLIAGESVETPVICMGSPFPNPFDSEIQVRVELKDNEKPVKVEVFNLRGQKVKTLFEGNCPKSKLHKWDGLDEGGRRVGSGVYLIRAQQDGKSAVAKVVRF